MFSHQFGADLVLCVFYVCFVAIVHAEIRLKTPAGGKFYAQENDTLYIEADSDETTTMCHVTPGETQCVRFRSSETDGYKNFKGGTKFNIEYRKIKMTSADAGLYRLDSGGIETLINVHLVTIKADRVLMRAEHEDVTLKCRVDGISGGYHVIWLRDGKVMADTSNDTLIISEAKREDVGAYMCIVTPNGSAYSMNATAFIESAPFISTFDRSKNLVQGDNVIIDCRVYGYPVPTIVWMKDEVPLRIDGNRTMLRPYNGLANASLTILDLNMDDRASYGCSATNSLNGTTEYILLRVKDKYAALWPFLGICAEVIILCAIIFIYEKRRSRKNANKENNAKGHLDGHGQKADEVRHRNKTPKA